MQTKHHHTLQNGCFQPQRAFNFRSIPCTVSFRLENEKWGEVFKMHPVLTVNKYFVAYSIQVRDGLELRILVTIKQFEKETEIELDPAEFLGKKMSKEGDKVGKKEVGKTIY